MRRATDRPTTLRARAARAVLLVLAGLLTLTGCDFSVYSLPLPGGVDLGDHPYSVRIAFQDVLDLVPESAVKVDDVTVGRVQRIGLRGHTAEVTVQLRGDVRLPDNAVAKIRQTSLLGEKFVSLSAPETGASPNRLGDGDVIPLSRTGRNPEVEEVLGALSLLLNGGGVAQLKTIASELNKALGGNEDAARSVLHRLQTFTSRLDRHKSDIVRAIESLNRLSVSLNKRKDTLDLALDELPGAVASIDSQRDDLVRMLQALSRLSSVGTRVIRQSKVATIDSLQALAPTLTKLAEAGDALPKSLQVFLTYPFVDAVVGRNPAQARNLHMGDYSNLSMLLDLDLTGESLPTVPGLPPVPDLIQICKSSPAKPICDQLPTSAVKKLCQQLPSNPLCDLLGGGSTAGPGGHEVLDCLQSADPGSKACQKLTPEQLQQACQKQANASNPLCQAVNSLSGLGEIGNLLQGGSGGTGGTGDGEEPDGSGGCLLGILCRPAPEGSGEPAAAPAPGARHDGDLGAMLVWGLVQR